MTRQLRIGKETVYSLEAAATRVLRIIDLKWADQGKTTESSEKDNT